MIENIPQLIALYSPTILAVASCLLALLKLLGKFTELKNEVKDKTDNEELKQQLKQCISDNAALKKKLNKATETISRVKESD